MSGPLSGSLVGGSLLCLDVIDSTNTECKRQAMAGAAEGLVVTAEEQTGGRGRRAALSSRPGGRGCISPPCCGPGWEPAQVANFTAWVAVAVCDGIQAACGLRPQIKWTNDIILNGKKLVGILTELGLVSESNDLDYLVTGIGVNVNQSAGDFDPEIPGYGHFFGPDSGAAGTPVGAGGSDYPGPWTEPMPVFRKTRANIWRSTGPTASPLAGRSRSSRPLPARGLRRCGGRRL